ncbi:MAG TPA: hypothetical protein VLL52_10500 [Anaerolineae bacterium]|nr:hypothetical protein [Anaerolineae bacterium]
MIWNIIRPNLWIIKRRLQALPTPTLPLIPLIPTLGLIWLYTQYLLPNRDFLANEFVFIFTALLPSSLFLLLLFALLGAGDIISILYLSPDLELLLAAPVPKHTIFLLKLLQCSRAIIFPLLIFTISFLLIGWAQQASLLYYPLIFLLLFAAQILITNIIVALLMLITQFVDATKIRTWMPLLVMVVTVAFMGFQQTAIAQLQTQSNLLQFLFQALQEIPTLFQLTTAITLITVTTTLLNYQLFTLTFYAGWNHWQTVPATTKPTSLTPPPQSPLFQIVPSTFRSFIRKEWLTLRRTPQTLIPIIQPPLMLIGMLLIPLFTVSATFRQTYQSAIFAGFLLMLSFMLGPLSFNAIIPLATEGPQIDILRASPIPMKTVLRAHFWATYIPIISLWLLGSFIITLILTLSWWQTIFLLFLILWGFTATIHLNLAFAGLTLKFEADEVRKRIPTLLNYPIMLINTLFTFATVCLGFWLLVRLIPNADLVLLLQELTNFRFINWLFSPNPLYPTLLLSSQLLYLFLTYTLWQAAIRRLTAWETP